MLVKYEKLLGKVRNLYVNERGQIMSKQDEDADLKQLIQTIFEMDFNLDLDNKDIQGLWQNYMEKQQEPVDKPKK